MFTRFFTSSAIAAWTIASVLPGGSCGPTTSDAFAQTPAVGIDVKPLAAQLSSGAQIYYSGSEAFTKSTVRWSGLSPPTPSVVIAPGTEKDVSQIVSLTVCESCCNAISQCLCKGEICFPAQNPDSCLQWAPRKSDQVSDPLS
jgi:hypothetical protein